MNATVGDKATSSASQVQDDIVVRLKDDGLHVHLYTTAVSHCGLAASFSVLTIVGWVMWRVKTVPEMTYNVSSGTLSPYSLTVGWRGQSSSLVLLSVHVVSRLVAMHSSQCHRQLRACTTSVPWENVANGSLSDYLTTCHFQPTCNDIRHDTIRQARKLIPH